MADWDFGGAFLKGMTGTADMLNMNKRTKLMEEEAGREKLKFDQDQHDRTMKLGIAGWYGKTFVDGVPNAEKMNEGVLSTPGFPEAWQELKPGTKYTGLEQDPERDDHVIIHFTNENGTPDFLTDDKDEVIRMPKKQVAAHMMGIMWQYQPELAKHVTDELAGQADENVLAELYGSQEPGPPPAVAGQLAQRVAPQLAGLAGAVVPGTAGGRPPVAPPQPTPAAAPAASAEEAPAPQPNASHKAGSEWADGVLNANLNATPAGDADPNLAWPRMSLRDIGRAGGNVYQSLKNQVTGAVDYVANNVRAAADGGVANAPIFDGPATRMAADVTGIHSLADAKRAGSNAVDFARGAVGMDPAPAPTKPAPKPQDMPRSAPAKDVVQAAQQRESTSTRTSVAVQQRSVPKLVQQNIAGINATAVPPKRTKAEVTDFARKVARLQRRGMLTAEAAQGEMDRFFGKTTKVVPAGGYLFGFDADNRMVSAMEIPMTTKDQAELSMRAQTVQAAFMTARAAMAANDLKDDRNRFKDRMAVNNFIMGSYDSKNKDKGLEAVARLDAAFQNLGLDERSPGVLALTQSAEGARRAFIENGWFREESDYRDLTPFILAGSIPTGDMDDPMEAANEMVLSPIRAVLEKTGANLNENALIGSVVNAAGYGIPADWAAAELTKYVETNPQAFANADAKRIGAALANEYRRQQGQ
jgi:hypothetical protein